MSNRTALRDRLAFDGARGEYRDGPIRYLMMRPDALMGMVAELPEAQRLTVLQALGRSVQGFGGRSVAAYRDAGATSPADLLRTMADTAAQLGWGAWSFSSRDGAVALDVANSPFASAAPAPYPVCHAIGGILAAMGPLVLGGPVDIAETRCAARDDGEVCHFEITASP